MVDLRCASILMDEASVLPSMVFVFDPARSHMCIGLERGEDK